MPGQPARYNAPDSPEAVVHDLPPIRFDGQLIAIRLQVRRSEDGIWRGRVLFGAADTEGERSTAEIFCATSEPDLWQSVRDRKSTRLNSSHVAISYAVFCLKKKKDQNCPAGHGAGKGVVGVG